MRNLPLKMELLRAGAPGTAAPCCVRARAEMMDVPPVPTDQFAACVAALRLLPSS